jgi:hypothetical protein
VLAEFCETAKELDMPAMLILLGATLLGGGPMSAEAQVREALLRLNEAFAKGDTRTIDALMTQDHVAVLSVGVRQTKAEALRDMGALKFEAYQTEDLKVTMLGKDAALLSFRAKIQGTFRGAPYPADNIASAVWVRQGAQWREQYYQETAAAGKR